MAVRGIRAYGRHGVFEEERSVGQVFVVDVVLSLDTRAAAASDDLRRTVDYGAVASAVQGILRGPSVLLLETLAQRIADCMLEQAGVQAVEVTVHKPEAKLGVAFADVSVTVGRGRA